MTVLSPSAIAAAPPDPSTSPPHLAPPPDDATPHGDAAAPSLVCRVRPSKRVLIPPPQYGLVEEGLHRSGEPSELHFAFVEKLGLKTVIWLAPEDPTEPFRQFLDEQRIRLVQLSADDYAATYDPLSEETVLRALNLILDPANAPCAVMCGQGRHRTGTAIGILRKLQRWNLTAILEEYRRYAGPKVRILNEQFIELFDVDLIAVPEADS
ncbi:hypothetical protein JCM10207_006676 [Rhodosporidiobolus poonsookiae]